MVSKGTKVGPVKLSSPRLPQQVTSSSACRAHVRRPWVRMNSTGDSWRIATSTGST